MSLRLWMLALSVAGLIAASGSLYLAGRRHAAERLEPQLAAMGQTLAAAQARAAAVGSMSEARHVAATRQAEAWALIAQPILEARTAEDGHAPLDPVRAERLRDADRQLCASGAGLAGCERVADAP